MTSKQDPFPAHIRRTEEREVRQPVSEHNRQTGQYAENALILVELGTVAKLAGLLHDMGKYTLRYRTYLENAVYGENTAARGSVNHSFAAVRYLLEHYHGRASPCGPLTAELLAYAAGAHHGLFDCVDGDHRSGFQHRLEKEDICYEEAVGNFLQYCAGEEELDALFAEAEAEIEQANRKLIPLLRQDETASEEARFYLGMLARLLISAVIEGDRRDTAEFEQDMRFPQARTPDELHILWETLSDRVDRKLGELPHRTEVEKARREISDRCRAFAEKPGGIYRLNVPTGAGKTLSSLRYALAHAARYGKSRILFVAPILAIIDQNSKVIRQYIGDDSLILEHHSNIVQETEADTPEAQEELDRREFLTATWESPIIVTTLFQLLNTLFSGRGSCIRRFHSLCGSILVIDEVQTVPSHLLTLFHLALGFLSEVCGATVILCSATQPCSEAARHPIAVPTPDMVPYDQALWRAFQRTELRDAGALPLAEIPLSRRVSWRRQTASSSSATRRTRRPASCGPWRRWAANASTSPPLCAWRTEGQSCRRWKQPWSAFGGSPAPDIRWSVSLHRSSKRGWTSPLPGSSACWPAWTAWCSPQAAVTGMARAGRRCRFLP